MHPSYFLISIDAECSSRKELSVSSETSEWLFHDKFWERFNQNHQTSFEQYEEECLPSKLTLEMINSLLVLYGEIDGNLVQ